MQWLFDKLEKESAVIRRAPLSFSIVCAVFLIFAFVVARWFYKETLSAKDAVISSYRDRLGLRPTTRYSGMENEELRADTFRLIAAIRANADGFEANDEKLLAAFVNELSVGRTDEAKTQTLKRQFNYLREHSSDFFKQFERRFRSDVMNARDELVRRLPREARLQFESLDDTASNPAQARDIATRLEQMAKLLGD